MLRSLCALLLLGPLTATAQTYTPKHIRFEGTGATDAAQLLAISGLHEGAPLSKEQIEAAMGKLADTGSFTDLSYQVDSNALTIKLTAAAGSQAQDVHFVNFVWWQPEELEKFLEARVPLYHGKLPLTGSLTDQVIAAAEALLREKGIDAKVETLQLRNDPHAISLTISRPSIQLGNITVPNAPKEASLALTKLHGRFESEDFDRGVTPRTLASEAVSIFSDSGFLDARAGQPAFAPPRKDQDRILLDATLPMTGLDLYRVSRITYAAAPPPVSESDLRKAAAIKPGDPAGVYELRVAEKSMEGQYNKHGYLDADISADVHKDASAHTAEYVFTLKPGEQYHVTSVTANGLSPDLQAAFAKSWRMPKDTAFDDAFHVALFTTLRSMGVADSVSYRMEKNKAGHTVSLDLAPRRATR